MENVTQIKSIGKIVMNAVATVTIVDCLIICIALIITIIKKNKEMKEFSKKEKNKKLSPYIILLIGVFIFLVYFIIGISTPPQVEIGRVYQQLTII